MIRVDRGDAPPPLAAERAQRLGDAGRKVAAGDKLERADIEGYRVAREALYAAQHRKCAYCEDSMKMPYEPVEHFRPAMKAIRGEGMPTTGYWWLAWTWENLLFACSICNSSHKKDRFPLVAGSAVLQFPEDPPGDEQAVLVDPARRTDPHPMELIVFQPVGRRWIPTGRNGDARGSRIVKVLGLDAPAHLPRYQSHVEEYLLPHVARLSRLMRAWDPEAFRGEWQQAVRHVRPVRPWAALAHDVLDYFFADDMRQEMGVELRRP